MITIQQEDLNAALCAVTRASLRSSLIAAFSLVRLDGHMNGHLNFSCFNGETAARAVTCAACEEELSVCVDAATLKAIVETMAGSKPHMKIKSAAWVNRSKFNRRATRSPSDLFLENPI